MKHSLYIVGAFILMPASSWAQKTDDSHQVQAGTRIGRVFVGDTRSAVGRRLGKPTRAFNLARGLSSQVWRGKAPNDQGAPNTLEVVYRDGVAIQLEATSLVFETPGRLSLSSARSKWEKAYGTPLVSTYNYSSGARKRYLDWKSKGIALELIQGADDNEWTYQTMIVHKKGTPVLADIGGQRE